MAPLFNSAALQLCARQCRPQAAHQSMRIVEICIGGHLLE
jgi:hypothetical protein